MYANTCGEIWVLDINASDTRKLLLIFIPINTIIFILTIFLNTSAAIVLWGLDEVQGCAKVILINMSLTDLLSGLLSQLLWISFMATQLAGHQICILAKATTFCGMLLWTVAFSTLVLASIERYICIFNPFFHQKIISSNKFELIILSFWITGLSTSIVYQFSSMKEVIHFLGAVVNSVGCFALVFVYARVCLFAHKVQKEIRHQAKVVRKQTEESGPQYRRGSIKMIVIIVGLSLLCYFPYGVSLYISTLSSIYVDARILCVLWTFALANPCVDPICYVLLNNNLRKKILDLWRDVFKIQKEQRTVRAFPRSTETTRQEQFGQTTTQQLEARRTEASRLEVRKAGAPRLEVSRQEALKLEVHRPHASRSEAKGQDAPKQDEGL